jgi:hypothetical protein
LYFTTAFSAGNDYTHTSLPSGFHARNVLIVMGTIVTLGFIASLIGE